LAIVTSRLHGRNVPESPEWLERRGNMKAGHRWRVPGRPCVNARPGLRIRCDAL